MGTEIFQCTCLQHPLGVGELKQKIPKQFKKIKKQYILDFFSFKFFLWGSMEGVKKSQGEGKQEILKKKKIPLKF